MMKTRRNVLVVLAGALVALGLTASHTTGQSSEDELRRILEREAEIETTLNDVVRHASRNGRATVPDADLEWDVSRLEAHLSFMDQALANLPCDREVPLAPDTTAALDALRGLIRGAEQQEQVVELQRKLPELNERKKFLEEVLEIANRLYKLKLIASMTELVLKILPTDVVSTAIGILDDITNLSQPGEVGKWRGKETYKRYLNEKREVVNLRMTQKANRMGRIDDEGRLVLGKQETSRMVAEVVRAETQEEIQALQQEIQYVEAAIEEATRKVAETDQRDQYFENLSNRLGRTVEASRWINHPEVFKKGRASLSVFVVDDASGVGLPSAAVQISPLPSGGASRANGRVQFDGLSVGSYRLEAEAEGYGRRSVEIGVAACKEYQHVFRLERQARQQPTPRPAPPAASGNHPPTVTLEADRRSVGVGGVVNLMAHAVDEDQDDLVYAWSDTAGSLTGAGPRAELRTAGLSLPPGAPSLDVVVTVVVEDGKGGVARAQLSVTVNASKPFTARLSCEGTLDLVPGEIDRSCGVVVTGWRGNTADRVEVVFPQLGDTGGSLPGQVVVFPGNTSQAPANMFTAGATDHHDRYEFPFHFSARSTAPAGTTLILILVRQPGAGEVRLALSVNVVPKGRLAVPGAANPPPAVQGSGGNTCVWRYKLFSEQYPNCWHFVAAVCDDARYTNPGNGYVLAGSGMTRSEAEALITDQGRYFADCEGRPPGSPGEDGPPPDSRLGLCRNLSNQAREAIARSDVEQASTLIAQAQHNRCSEIPGLRDTMDGLAQGLAEAEALRRQRLGALCAGIEEQITACDYEGALAVSQELDAEFFGEACPGLDRASLPELAADQAATHDLLRSAQSTVAEKDVKRAIELLRQSLDRAPDCMAGRIESLVADMEARSSDVPSWLQPGEGTGSDSSSQGDSSSVPDWIAPESEDPPESQDENPPSWIASPGGRRDSPENRDRADRAVEEAGRELAQIYGEEDERRRRLEEQRRQEEERRREEQRRLEEERRLAAERRRALEEQAEEEERRRAEEERRENRRAWEETLDRVLVAVLDNALGDQQPPSPPSPPPSPPEPRTEPDERRLEDIVVRSRRVTITVWDAECEDGDRITVLINDVPVLNNHQLFNRKEAFDVTLPYETNTIEVFANNGGTDCPPGRKPLDQTVNSGAITVSDAIQGGRQTWRLRQRAGSKARIVVRQ